MEDKLYTAGQMADLAGVSLKTIRFYDAKGLLKPVSYSDAGYRYYNRDSVVRLQRIIMLKYLGFSLQQIAEMISVNTDFDGQMKEQKKFLMKRKQLLDEMLSTIELLEKTQNEDKWDVLQHLLKLMSTDEKVVEQYQNSSNLEKRISIHVYNTNEEKYMHWVFRNMDLQPGMRILEIGCGTGLLWCDNIQKLPRGLRITLTDRSEGMLEQTKSNLKAYEVILKEKDIVIEFQVLDANELQLEARSMDVIIANHMLYHVKKRKECLKEIKKALATNGTFFCTTVGERHMEELHKLVAGFDERIELPYESLTREFWLEKGEEQLLPYFKNINRIDYISDLDVPNAEVVYSYVQSFPGNAPYILEQKGNEFLELIEEKINKDGSIYIHKSTGMFICKK